MAESEQLFDFAAEPVALEPWHVLIVDDEPAVHEVTRLVLGTFRFEGRPLQFHHAHSGAEARKLLRETNDIAVLLLDVVMESDQAGLDVVKFVREELHNHFVRIVLRTGQPGQAPEHEVIDPLEKLRAGLGPHARRQPASERIQPHKCVDVAAQQFLGFVAERPVEGFFRQG